MLVGKQKIREKPRTDLKIMRISCNTGKQAKNNSQRGPKNTKAELVDVKRLSVLEKEKAEPYGHLGKTLEPLAASMPQGLLQ